MNTKFQVGCLCLCSIHYKVCNRLSIIFTENVSCWITIAIVLILLLNLPICIEFNTSIDIIDSICLFERKFFVVVVFLIKLRFLLIFLFIYQSIDFLGGHHWRNRQRRYGLWWCVHLPWTLYSLDIIQYNIDSSSPLLTDQSLFLCSTCILGCAWVCAKILYVNVLELKGVLRHHIVYIFIEYFFYTNESLFQ